MTIEPTEQQIEQLWKWCGFKQVPRYGGTDMTETVWEYPRGYHDYILPDIDTNNLYKYVVPKVMECDQNYVNLTVRRYIVLGHADFRISYACEIWSDNGQGSILKYADTPALALFWAIWEGIKDDK